MGIVISELQHLCDLDILSDRVSIKSHKMASGGLHWGDHNRARFCDICAEPLPQHMNLLYEVKPDGQVYWGKDRPA
jgi:hypothetical protein